MTHHDIAIVGSGPSGMVAGVHALKHGYRTIILEQGATVDPSPPRFEATPSNGILRLVDRMKIPYESLSYRTMWVSPSEFMYLESSNTPDLIIRRGGMPDSLCEVLKERFLDAGGEIMFRQRVHSVEVSGGAVRQLNGGDLDVSFDWLIWAGGETVPTLEKFCLAPKVMRTMHGAGTMFDSEGVPDRVTVYLDPRRSPGGYLYEVTSGGRTSIYNVTVGGDPDRLFRDTHEYLASRGIPGAALTYGHAHTSPWGKRCILENVLLAGDAGAMNDYGFGYGTRSAILSGHHAAESIAKDYNYDLIAKKPSREAWKSRLVRRCLDRFEPQDWDAVIGLMDNTTSFGPNVGWKARMRRAGGVCRAVWRLL